MRPLLATGIDERVVAHERELQAALLSCSEEVQGIVPQAAAATGLDRRRGGHQVALELLPPHGGQQLQGLRPTAGAPHGAVGEEVLRETTSTS